MTKRSPRSPSAARAATRDAEASNSTDTSAPLLIAASTLVVALLQGLFAFVLYVVIGNTKTATLFQGIASALIGRVAFLGGARTLSLGIALHVLVALAWSVIFLIALRATTFIPRMLASRFGALKVAAWYGPLVYIVMTMAVIPIFTHRVPPITVNWLTMLLGHIVFVGLPIALIVGRSARDWNR